MPSTPEIIKKLEEIVALEGNSTSMEGHEFMRYEHGGARLYTPNQSNRTLIADFYHEGDRELFYALRNSIPTLKEAVKVIERQREALEIIAGTRRCPDNLLGNADIARTALSGSHDHAE